MRQFVTGNPHRHFADRALTAKNSLRPHFGTPPTDKCGWTYTPDWHHESNRDYRIRQIQLDSNDKELPAVMNLIGIGHYK